MSKIDINIFDNDERIIINESSVGMRLVDFTRESFIKSLSITLNITEDKMIIELTERLITKVMRLGDSEWVEIINKLPLPVAYDSATLKLLEEAA